MRDGGRPEGCGAQAVEGAEGSALPHTPQDHRVNGATPEAPGLGATTKGPFTHTLRVPAAGQGRFTLALALPPCRVCRSLPSSREGAQDCAQAPRVQPVSTGPAGSWGWVAWV